MQMTQYSRKYLDYAHSHLLTSVFSCIVPALFPPLDRTWVVKSHWQGAEWIINYHRAESILRQKSGVGRCPFGWDGGVTPAFDRSKRMTSDHVERSSCSSMKYTATNRINVMLRRDESTGLHTSCPR
jgi:hypothetical protein